MKKAWFIPVVLLILLISAFPVCVNADSAEETIYPVTITPGSLIIKSGESVQLSAYPDYGSSYIWYSDNKEVATVAYGGRLTGVSPGVTVIHAYYLTGNLEKYLGDCTVYVFDAATIDNDTYFIQPDGQSKMLCYGSTSTTFENLDKDHRPFEQLLILPGEDAYTIYDLSHQSYLCAVQTGSGYQLKFVPTVSLTDTTQYKWKILKNIDNDSLIFSPYSVTGTSLVLTTRTLSSGLLQPMITDYHTIDQSTYNINSAWQIYYSKFKVYNYCDTSVNGKMTLISAITGISDFIENDAFSQFGDFFTYTSSVSFCSDAVSSQCPLPVNTPCNSSCGESASHHKNELYMMTWLINKLPRKNNQINIMWADRPGNAYTLGLDAIAFSVSNGNVFYPVVQMLNITNYEFTTNYYETVRAICATTAAHEFAHLMGLPDVYDNTGHDVIGTRCIMEKLDIGDVSSYYSRIQNGLSSPFCDSCYESLDSLIYNVYFRGNAKY